MHLQEHHITLLKERLLKPLPGTGAHDKMSSSFRKTESLTPKPGARDSAVLIIVYSQNGQLYIPYIRRPEYPGVHSGQIAFPGGKKEEADEHLMATALRETFEEVGVMVSETNVLGQMTKLYIPPSNMYVTPYVAFLPYIPSFTPEPSEVAEILHFSIEELRNQANHQEVSLTVYGNIKINTPAYVISREVIWGATAMMTAEFLHIFEEAGL